MSGTFLNEKKREDSDFQEDNLTFCFLHVGREGKEKDTSILLFSQLIASKLLPRKRISFFSWLNKNRR